MRPSDQIESRGAEDCTRAILDVSRQERAEQLERAVKIMEQQTRELAVATHLANQANRAKSEFIANMSRELRTPLHGILSFAAFGIKRYADVDRKNLLRYFERIHESGMTLLSLLNDVLDLAKLESGKSSLDLEAVRVGELVAEVVDDFSQLASERRVLLRFDRPASDVPLTLDSAKIKQVIRNLLSNAVKFSPEGGEVVTSVLRIGDAVRVAVRDQGPGISADELELIFDKFVQSSRIKSGAGGTGLGLSICQEIMAAHGGVICAENNRDGGATFVMEIPAIKPQNREPLADAALS